MSGGSKGQFFRDDTEKYHEHNIHIAKRWIFVNGDINEESCNEFIKNMNLLDASGKDPITVHIHTMGGDELPGWAMYDRIRQSNCQVEGIVYGDCSSMGTIILQAFDIRKASENSLFLFHEGSMEIGADHVRNVEAAAKMIPFENDRMYKVYALATGQTKKQLQKLFSFDKYLTAEQALRYGFIDRVLRNPKPKWLTRKQKTK